MGSCCSCLLGESERGVGVTAVSACFVEVGRNDPHLLLCDDRKSAVIDWLDVTHQDRQ